MTRNPRQETRTERTTHAECARILLAEDMPVIIAIVRGILEAAGHLVDVVTDGVAAVAAVSTGRYDLVLMDVHMPILGGASATKRIRALPGAKGSIPVIAMTAKSSSKDRDYLRDAGMTGYLAKPFRKAQLLEAIALWRGSEHPPIVPESLSRK